MVGTHATSAGVTMISPAPLAVARRFAGGQVQAATLAGHPETANVRPSPDLTQRASAPLRDRARDDDEIAAVPAAVRPEVAGAGDQHQPRRSADVEDLLVVDQVGARHLA